MAPTKLTARKSTGKRSPPKQQIPKSVRNAIRKQLKQNESRLSVVVQTNDAEEVKYDPNMVIKTENLPEIKIEPGTSTHPIEDLTAAQEQVTLVKNLISKTEKLEAEVLEKNARVKKLCLKLFEMKNTMEVQKKSFQSQLKKQESEARGSASRWSLLLLKELHMLWRLVDKRDKGLLQKIERHKAEKESVQARFDQLRSKSAAMRQSFVKEKQRLREMTFRLKHKLTLKLRRLGKQESKSSALCQRFTPEEQRLRKEISDIQQKLDLGASNPYT